tara:strand:- start:1274 stop:1702 length:429 start_codon:yes stop_codon:yes gene_type:complete
MSDQGDKSSEIPDFVKKYIPGVMRGLSWAKYSKEKKKGTAMKVAAFQDAQKQGFEAASKAPRDIDTKRMMKEITESMWIEANVFTEEAKKISMKINNQKNKEERERILNLAKEAARKAGLQGAIAAGWEKGWKEGIDKKINR